MLLIIHEMEVLLKLKKKTCLQKPSNLTHLQNSIVSEIIVPISRGFHVYRIEEELNSEVCK